MLYRLDITEQTFIVTTLSLDAGKISSSIYLCAIHAPLHLLYQKLRYDRKPIFEN